MPDHGADLRTRVLAGEPSAVARALTLVERGHASTRDWLPDLYRAPRHAHVLGITGPAGSGKSTLTACLAGHLSERGLRVGIIAVDPSSIYSGGAILGDRIRMTALSGNELVFIRSMAARGAMGGLSRAVSDGVVILAAAGYDVVVIETLGVGQAEVEVISVAETVVVVSVPGLGDGVQALKAGLLEIADIHVVNKSDRDGSQQTAAELKEMLRLTRRRAGQWNVPVLLTSAASGTGMDDLVAQLGRHRDWLARDGGLAAHLWRGAEARLLGAVDDAVRRRVSEHGPEVARSLELIVDRSSDPITESERILEVIFGRSLDGASRR